MEVLDPKSIAIVFLTYYPNWYRGRLQSIKHTDKIRGDLALECFKKTVEKGYQAIVVDGKSTATFRKELSSIDGIQVIKRKSPQRSPAKRQGIIKASQLEGVEVIVLTEAEKVNFITDCIPLVVGPILKKEADIVVPKRNDELFKSSYPDYMWESEREGNTIYNEALFSHGVSDSLLHLDTFFGPRVFRNTPKIRAFFLKKFVFRTGKVFLTHKLFDMEEYSNALFFPVVLALKKKISVKSVEVPFVYPKIQKENETVGQRSQFVEKRQLQRMSVLIDLMHFLSYLENQRSSKIKSK